MCSICGLGFSLCLCLALSYLKCGFSFVILITRSSFFRCLPSLHGLFQLIFSSLSLITSLSPSLLLHVHLSLSLLLSLFPSSSLYFLSFSLLFLFLPYMYFPLSCTCTSLNPLLLLCSQSASFLDPCSYYPFVHFTLS